MKKIKYIIFLGLISFLGINNIYAEDMCAVCGPESLPIPIGVPNFVSKLILIAQIATPVIIIVMAMIKYFKAVTSGDEKVIKETNSSFIRSLITGVSIFLIVTIVKVVFGIIGTDATSSLNCVSCFLNGEDDCSMQVCPSRDSNKTSSTSFCFQCSSNQFDKVWSKTTPEASSSCKDGYVLTNMSKGECKSKCYQCNSNSSKYVWSSSNPGTTTVCPGGYHTVNLTKDECKAQNSVYACYQCNNDGNIYKWNDNNGADESCPSGYHSTTINKESDCHN